jgi:hypothetical protein
MDSVSCLSVSSSPSSLPSILGKGGLPVTMVPECGCLSDSWKGEHVGSAALPLTTPSLTELRGFGAHGSEDWEVQVMEVTSQRTQPVTAGGRMQESSG